MNIAVSSYSFSQAMRDGRMNMMSVIPMAKKLGYEGIEVVRGNQSDKEMRALAQYLKTQSEDEGIPIIAYMVSADFIKNGVDFEVERLKKEVEIAALLGAPRMRHDSSAGVDAYGNKVTFEEALPVIAEGYRRVTEFAAGLGVKTMIENHGYFMQDSCRVDKLIDTVNHPNFGWLVDIGNFMCADEDPVGAVTVGAKKAVHAHAKDFHYKPAGAFTPANGWFPTRGGAKLRGAIIGHGVVDVPKCLSLFKQNGYNGWLSVEFEGIEDCIKALEEDILNLRTMLSQI